MRTNIYLEKFRRLLTQNKVDALLIYANGYDDRFMRALTGTYSILQDYLFITWTDFVISEPGYLIPETKRRTNIELIPADGEDLVIEPIVKILGSNKRMGFIGNCRFRDVEKLNPSFTVDLTTQADQIIRFKTDEFIDKISKPAGILAQIIEGIKIFSGVNQLEVDKRIKQKIIASDGQFAFPPCVTSGNDLNISTCLSPKDKHFSDSDIVCIDAGLKNDIFTTDMTRMFFINHQKGEEIYRSLYQKHLEILNEKVAKETLFSELIGMYREIAEITIGVIKLLSEDFGHGIGFGLHEPPMLEKTDGKIGVNIVFTIEPTFVTKFGMMRFEDMVAINSKGQIEILTARKEIC